MIWGLIIGAVAGLLVGVYGGILLRKRVAESKIGSAEKQAMKLLDDAIKQAETRKKETLLEAKEEILASKNEAENEIKERRKEVSRLERRLQQKEEVLDRKTESIEKKENSLADKHKEADELKAKVTSILDEQLVRLEKVAGLTSEEAKAEIVQRLDGEIAHEKALKLAE